MTIAIPILFLLLLIFWDLGSLLARNCEIGVGFLGN